MKFMTSFSPCGFWRGCNVGVKDVVVQYREQDFDHTVIDPTPDNSIATGIDSVANDQLHATGGTWYTLDGQQLNTNPTQKGIYLFKGKKVVVK